MSAISERSQLVAVASATACAAVGLCAASTMSTFVASPVVSPAVQQQSAHLRGYSQPESTSSQGTSAFGAATVGGLALTAAAAGLARNQRRQTTRYAAVKKKGVRVIDGKEIPWNLFSPKAPYKGTVVSNETITSRTKLPNWETTHTIFDHGGNVPYLEGQSIGIIAPGPDKKGEVPAKIRLYSIASSSPGDDETSKTVSLCVKRVLEVEGMGWCEYSNVEPGTDREYPDAGKVYRGVCSNHICDMKAGDEALITGPVGAEMLLPEDPESNYIFMATGTGIAPFRSHLRHLFYDKVSKNKAQGLAWLFLGVPFSQSILYDEEWKAMQAEYPTQFRFDYAVSNEEKSENNKRNGQMYVQHKMMVYQDELWELVKSPKTHVYMCGLKGMESGFAEAFQSRAEAEGLDWAEFLKSMKKADRYHVEVY